MQRFATLFASLLWFFIGYWILKARLDFYPASSYFGLFSSRFARLYRLITPLSPDSFIFAPKSDFNG